MMFISIFLILLVLIIIWPYLPKEQGSAEYLILARQDLSDLEILAFFNDTSLDAGEILKYWHDVADSLELPYEKLRATDRFYSEYYPKKGFEYDAPVYGLLNEMIDSKCFNQYAIEALTLRDFIIIKILNA